MPGGWETVDIVDMRIRKRVMWMALVWVAATALTAGVALAVVGLAGEQVADEAVRPLTAGEVEALGMPPSATTSPAAAVTGIPGPDTTEPGAAGSTTIPGAAGTTTTIPAPAPATTPETTPTPATTAPSAEEPVVDSRRVTGGTVVVRWTSSWVEFVSATPDDGFDVDVEDGGPEHVEVEFEGSGVVSRYVAEVSGGSLVVEVHVDDDEDGGDGDDGDDD